MEIFLWDKHNWNHLYVQKEIALARLKMIYKISLQIMYIW